MPIWTPDEPKSARDALERLAELESIVTERKTQRDRDAGREQHVGPLYAVRCWTLQTQRDGSYALGSVGVGATWVTATLDAICTRDGMCLGAFMGSSGRRVRGRSRHVGHGPVPAYHGSCGIYSYKTWNDWNADFGGNAAVVGIVELSGRVIVHQGGYRAARATIVAAAILADAGKTTGRSSRTYVDSLSKRYPDVPFFTSERLLTDKKRAEAVRFLYQAVPDEWAKRIFHVAGTPGTEDG